MLHAHFVGVTFGSYFNKPIHWYALSTAHHTSTFPPIWFPSAPREPPDPVTPDTPHISYIVNTSNITYNVTKRSVSSSKYGALVDRGANGGIAGSDVRPLYHTDRMVDVQGIDNHQLNIIPIVTAAGVVDTQHGPIVLIMNQYAHIPTSKTIHASGQLEAHGVTVDDRAIPNGGYQRIITQGGYVIPLQVCSGLVYMDMRPSTDAELKIPSASGLPQIILISDLD